MATATTVSVRLFPLAKEEEEGEDMKYEEEIERGGIRLKSSRQQINQADTRPLIAREGFQG